MRINSRIGAELASEKEDPGIGAGRR